MNYDWNEEELELFEALEKDVDNGSYKPLEKKVLDNKKSFFKKEIFKYKTLRR